MLELESLLGRLSICGTILNNVQEIKMKKFSHSSLCIFTDIFMLIHKACGPMDGEDYQCPHNYELCHRILNSKGLSFFDLT